MAKTHKQARQSQFTLYGIQDIIHLLKYRKVLVRLYPYSYYFLYLVVVAVVFVCVCVCLFLFFLFIILCFNNLDEQRKPKNNSNYGCSISLSCMERYFMANVHNKLDHTEHLFSIHYHNKLAARQDFPPPAQKR